MDQPSTPEPPRSRWMTSTIDRVPTKWLTALVTALFLAATAAFGGLATAVEPPLPRMEAGDVHRGAQLSVAVQRAVLIDDFSEAGASAGDGERILALIVDVENLWDRPVRSTVASLDGSLRLDGVEGPPVAIARLDDATRSPTLQPSVPASVVVAWRVPEGFAGDGDTIAVTILDQTLRRGTFVLRGEGWSDPVAAGIVDLEVEDVGAGADR